MNPRSNPITTLGLLALAVALFSASPALEGAAPAPAPAPAKTGPTNAAPVEIPKSLFVDDYKVGRDPFYPASNRRNPAPPPQPKPAPGVPVAGGPAAVTNAPPPPPPPPPPVSKFVSLKGILGGPRPLAIINTVVKSYELEAGEEIEAKVPDETRRPEGRAKIRCLQIKAESVVLEIEGESGQREVRLPRRI